MPAKFSNIPTNVITGFLGTGKTTVIRHLLKQKPEGERWAVLVNEFGEVGIDGALLSSDGIAVKEVPGGCMCCSVGVPSRTALNRLIREHKPDRILVEPTGLAHPKQIVDMLGASEYQGVLDLQAVVCLVDPWCLQDERFLSIQSFHDQIAMSDVLVAAKADLAEAEHLQVFERFADDLTPAKSAVTQIENGQLDWRLLQHPHQDQQVVEHHHHHHDHDHDHDHHGHKADESAVDSTSVANADADGVVRIENSAEYAVSCGWKFDGRWQFDGDALQRLITDLPVPRIKGVFATTEGWLAINKVREVVSSEVIDASDSRIEMITTESMCWKDIDQQLRACGRPQ